MLRYLFFFLTGFLIIACQSLDETGGPYFGNGLKNGWADQNSIVIWTRLTKYKDAYFEGEPFKEISKNLMLSLAKNPNIDSIYNTQIPKGFKLSDMEGYCPGMDGEVQLVYYQKSSPNEIVVSDWVKVDKKKDFTYQWNLSDLKSGGLYGLKIFSRQKGSKKIQDSIFGSFVLPSEKSSLKPVKFCVVSCHDFNRRDDIKNGHKIYPSMDKIKPDFYIHTGDIEYMDKPNPYAMTEELMRFKWNRIFSLPFQRNFYNNYTSYFMKDDHDIGFNDSYPGRDYGAVSFERGLEIFDLEQFPSHEKRYKTVRWGKDLQIWIVEGRNYRSPNNFVDGPNKTIWGENQKNWFYETVSNSDASFKVLITSSPILGPDKINKNDNLSNDKYAYEQTEILDFIKKQNNLYIINGDRHWQYVTHIDGTNLWEFGCGAGTDFHSLPTQGGWNREDPEPQHKYLRLKGGFLSVETSKSNYKSKISFNHHDVNGKIVNTKNFFLENKKSNF